MARITVDQLLELIKEKKLENQAQFEFKDNCHQIWKVDLSDYSSVADDSIPEDELTDDDYKDYPNCELRCLDNCYLEFSSTGDNQEEALLQCLWEADLISKEVFTNET